MNKPHEAMQEQWRALFSKPWLFPVGIERLDETEYIKHFEEKHGRLKCFRGPETYTLEMLESQQEAIVDTYQIFLPQGQGTWLRTILQFSPTAHAIADLVWSAEVMKYHCPLSFYVSEAEEYKKKLLEFEKYIFDPSAGPLRVGF